MSKIVHISDTHITGFFRFREKKYDKLIEYINNIVPDIVIHTGDITDEGYLTDYRLAKKKLKMIESDLIVNPGNHDVRNLGRTLYPRFIKKKRVSSKKVKIGSETIGIVSLDSAVPDLDEGRVGEVEQKYLKKSLKKFKNIRKIVTLHHHLIPVPEAGRERNVVDDAGDILKIIIDNDVDLVLLGHRHVPNATKVENTIIINAGTLSCTATRAYHSNSFNLIHLKSKRVKIEKVKLLDNKIEKDIIGNYRLK